jgi:hypothetical protein
LETALFASTPAAALPPRTSRSVENQYFPCILVLKIAVVVMVISGTFFMAVPGHARRGYHHWGWGRCCRQPPFFFHIRDRNRKQAWAFD